MDINHANISEFFEDLATQFLKGFNSTQESSILDNIAWTIPSRSSSMTHAWLNQIPDMREWLGDRIVNNVQSDKLTIVNKKYQSTIEMERTEIEDDEHGVYRNIAMAMGETARAFPDKSIVDTMASGNTDTWADDVAFFSDSRTYGSNTIDNLSASALSATEINTAYEKITGYKGHNDKPLNVRPRWLVYGPKNRTTAFDILQNEFVAGSSVQIQNVNKNLLIPLESSRLVGDYDDYWFIASELAGVRPVVWQDRMPAEFQTARLGNDSDFVFEKDKYQFGTRLRGRAFLSMPHLLYAGIL